MPSMRLTGDGRACGPTQQRRHLQLLLSTGREHRLLRGGADHFDERVRCGLLRRTALRGKFPAHPPAVEPHAGPLRDRRFGGGLGGCACVTAWRPGSKAATCSLITRWCVRRARRCGSKVGALRGRNRCARCWTSSARAFWRARAASCVHWTLTTLCAPSVVRLSPVVCAAPR